MLFLASLYSWGNKKSRSKKGAAGRAHCLVIKTI
nr:MAG TPA_asm: hypothetical protein [Caudoviricetes sp.]